jgi:C1A family cysteine protease
MNIIDFIKNLFKKQPVKRKYGWIKDKKDLRDKLYKDILSDEVLVTTDLPSSVDLTSKLPPCYDQGQLGSCTANGIAGALAFIEKGEMHSRLFIYYNERALEGTVRQDAGAQIRDGIKVVVKQGACPETMWPYIESKFKCKPSSVCYKNALTDRVISYLKVVGLQQLKSCLAAGFPVVIGFQVYESFESNAVAKTGIVPMPGKNEQCVGGHCVLVIGYDDADKTFLVRNSWGTGWGINGNFKMPQDYLADPALCTDNWTIRSASIAQLKRRRK